jgi:signal transduction histidine kinase
MDSSRLQAGTLRMSFQPVRLDVLLREISLRASSRYDNLEVSLDLHDTGLQIQADPARLAQVFDNLLGNASKYAPGSPVVISLHRDGNFVRIAVKDRGPGIPAENLEHLFTRFYRVPELTASVRGTGLGLYICRQIVQAHLGEISAESTIGEGTTFNILLPLEGVNPT